MPRQRSRRRIWLVLQQPAVFLVAVVLFALLVRLIVVVAVIHSVASTGVAYNTFSWEMGLVARSIALGQGFSSPFEPMTGPTALVPPVYPFLMAGAYKLFGMNSVRAAFAILSFNSVCSALTCVPLYFLAVDGVNKRVARMAAIGWAIYPFSIYFAAGRVWDYALTSLLFVTCLWAAQRLHVRGISGWIGFGLLYGVAVLSNPSIVSLLPFLLMIAVYKLHTSGTPWLSKSLVTMLAFLAVCMPWNLRNEHVLHSRFFLRDGFWLEFYAGNNGDMAESNTASVHPPDNPAEMQRYEALGEIAYMQEKRALSLDFVQHHPGVFVLSTARRIVRFWTGYWSLRPAYLRKEPFDIPNIPFCLFLTLFMARGLLDWWKRDREAVLPYVLAILIFPLPYYLTHSSTDYRQPLEPVVLALVTVGLFGFAPERSSVPLDNAHDAEFDAQSEGVFA